jgi:hypothetical protein
VVRLCEYRAHVCTGQVHQVGATLWPALEMKRDCARSGVVWSFLGWVVLRIGGAMAMCAEDYVSLSVRCVF